MPNFKAPTIQEVDVVTSPSSPDIVAGVAAAGSSPPVPVNDGEAAALWVTRQGSLVIAGAESLLAASPMAAEFTAPSSNKVPGTAAPLATMPTVYDSTAAAVHTLRGQVGVPFVMGSIAINAASVARPVTTGGIASSTEPANVIDGRVQQHWLSLSGAQVVDGGIAHDAVDSGNPVKIGGRANNVQPASVAVGDRVNALFSVNGAFAIGTINSAPFDGTSNSEGNPSLLQGGAAPVGVFNRVFNGTTWDRQRGDTTGAYAVGNVAHDAVDVGNPVKVGGVANSGTPAPVAIGDRVNAWYGINGAPVIGAAQLAAQDGLGNANAALLAGHAGTLCALQAMPSIFNGTSWDRQRKADRTSRIPTSAATTNATSAKNAAGDLRSIVAVNTTAALIYLKFCNVAVAPTPGTTPVVFTVPLAPNNVPTVVNLPDGGLYFSTGIGYYLCTGAADADATAVGAGAVTSLSVTFD